MASVGFFSKVNITYDAGFQRYHVTPNSYFKTSLDSHNELFDYFEAAADICRTPSRWITSLANVQREYNAEITNSLATNTSGNPYIQVGANYKELKLSGNIIHKIMRIAIGVILAIPGEVIGSLFMAVAYCGSVVRAKRTKLIHSVFETPNIVNPSTLWINTEFKEKSSWGKITVAFTDGEILRTFIIHRESGEIFNDDPKCLIRFKGFGLIMGTSLMTAARVLNNLAQAILNIAIIIPISILEGRIGLVDAGKKILLQIYNIFKPIIFALVLTLAAFYTIISPYNGRQLYGRLERKLHGHERGIHGNKFYLAICFQLLGLDTAPNKAANKRIGILDARTLDRLKKVPLEGTLPHVKPEPES